MTHIWYFKGVPSRLGYLLDLAPKDLEKVIYFAAYMITAVDTEQRHKDLPSLEAQIQVEKKEIENRRDAETKTALSRLALGQLEIKALLHELIAETRAHELRTDYPHEDTDTDARFV